MKNKTILAVLFLAASPLQAAEVTPDYNAPDEAAASARETPPSYNRLFVSTGVFSLALGKKQVGGPHLGAGVAGAVSRYGELAASVGQGYTKELSLATYYTSYELTYGYQLLGGSYAGRSYELGGRDFAAARAQDGLRLKMLLGARQYFFNLTDGALYFSGASVGVSASYPLFSGFTASVSLGMDMISNGGRALTPQRITAGFSYHLK